MHEVQLLVAGVRGLVVRLDDGVSGRCRRVRVAAERPHVEMRADRSPRQGAWARKGLEILEPCHRVAHPQQPSYATTRFMSTTAAIGSAWEEGVRAAPFASPLRAPRARSRGAAASHALAYGGELALVVDCDIEVSRTRIRPRRRAVSRAGGPRRQSSSLWRPCRQAVTLGARRVSGD